MTEIPITKDEWHDWLRSKVTQEFLRRMWYKREMLKEGIAEGQASDREELQTVIGRCQGLQDVLVYARQEFEYIDTSNSEGEIIDGNSNRV